MAAKIVVAGGFGAGKTTFVASVSEIVPLTTEAVMTSASLGVDDTGHTPDKDTTTVAMDFGRVSLDDGLILFLFGTPGQHRFWFMWDDLVRGAIGAIVLVDTRRLADSFAPVDFFEDRGLPFVLGLNQFDGILSHGVADVRSAIGISEDVPIVPCDARDRESVKRALIELVEHAMRRARQLADAELDVSGVDPAGIAGDPAPVEFGDGGGFETARDPVAVELGDVAGVDPAGMVRDPVAVEFGDDGGFETAGDPAAVEFGDGKGAEAAQEVPACKDVALGEEVSPGKGPAPAEFMDAGGR